MTDIYDYGVIPKNYHNQDVKVARLNDVGTALEVGGVAYTLSKYSTVTALITADTAAIANNAAIPFDTLVNDDIGLTTPAWASDKTKLYFPATTKFIRVSYELVYKYVGAVPTGTNPFRGAKVVISVEGGPVLTPGGDNKKAVPTPTSVATAYEAILGGITARLAPTVVAGINNNYIQLFTYHNAAASSVLTGGANNINSYLLLEIWE